VNVTGHVDLLHNARPWFGPSLEAVGGSTSVIHIGDQVVGVFDDEGHFTAMSVPATYGCTRASKHHFILGTSAEVVGFIFDSTHKRVLTADGLAIPTPRDARQVCSTQAIVIPTDYSPSNGSSALDIAYNEWLTRRSESTLAEPTPLHAHGMDGWVRSVHCGVLAEHYSAAAYFDSSDLARRTYLENNQCSVAYGSLDSVIQGLGDDTSFFQDACGTDVGIAGPPCGSFSRANRLKSEPETATSVALLIEYVIYIPCEHKTFICENVCEALSVRHGGEITAALAGLASEHDYIIHLCILDPTNFGSCQTRDHGRTSYSSSQHYTHVEDALTCRYPLRQAVLLK
jgi:hypothetical protein